ncbi:unnamed protein product [Trichogramma brassicae]|uniref:Uncharacterized protein n=1 Tax=Trichogramma brassicae TaxID=86971 RepID=A0A6H5J314_9HYME|nr:unnamed protein product [Trichogramma brassicae]
MKPKIRPLAVNSRTASVRDYALMLFYVATRQRVGWAFENRSRSYALLEYVPEELLQELRVEPDATISRDRRNASDTGLSDRRLIRRRRGGQVEGGCGDGSSSD